MKKHKCPYDKMEQAFEYCDLEKYRTVITAALNATCSKRIYSLENPGYLMDYFDRIISLIKATHCINGQEHGNILRDKDNLFDRKFFFGKYQYLSEWQYIPHALTEEEYENPYLVIKPFFSEWNVKKWKKMLKLILRYALSRDVIVNENEAINILAVHTQLIKLVEAAHLLVVRRRNYVASDQYTS